jgi:peroxiredoxin
MKFLLFLFVLGCAQVSTQTSSFAQPISIGMGSIRRPMRIDENTPLFDKTSGKRVSYKAYQELLNKDRYGYHLEPIIDEYGQTSAYTLRSTTPEERETHMFKSYDTSQRPKVGQPMPEFVMRGIDDKVYRLSELKGRVILLSFWISLAKPFWGPNQAKAFGNVLRPYQSETDPISLGILKEPKDVIDNVMTTETLPFIPVPESYGFNQKFQVTTGPSFIVIDRAGKVAAFIEGSNYDQLQKVLQAVSR